MSTFVVMHIIYNTHTYHVYIYIYIIHPYTPYIQYFINLSRLLFWEAIKKHLLRLFVCCPEKLKADPSAMVGLRVELLACCVLDESSLKIGTPEIPSEMVNFQWNPLLLTGPPICWYPHLSFGLLLPKWFENTQEIACKKRGNIDSEKLPAKGLTFFHR